MLTSLPLLGFAQKGGDKDSFDNDHQGIEVVINGEKVSVLNLPQDGVVEVFNILGSKMTTFVVNNGVCSSRVNLPKGYYILKSDNITKKIVVK
ncbi:Por secretion system C-terminal sorting domain-containing protein [Dysgonomonas macrotermitis]|uniref:Por secretion system C-terminal sorting domain-containing protein n=2 Tax=Dysgonomonas macrotermitis TaxID=1346286 RepID=A0A1M5D869_9BACT|nr:Por secretion system C-terminal sorting domain-containing protein [Dysgonomonas macrotermitis]